MQQARCLDPKAVPSFEKSIFYCGIPGRAEGCFDPLRERDERAPVGLDDGGRPAGAPARVPPSSPFASPPLLPPPGRAAARGAHRCARAPVTVLRVDGQTGRPYYHNAATGTTSWSLPEGSAGRGLGGAAPLPPGWEARLDPGSGR